MLSIEDLPEEILLEVLSLVPSVDLIYICRLVCSQWRHLVDSQELWKRKLRRRDDGPETQESKAFCIFLRLKKNLIMNPSGKEGLDFWEIMTSAEGRWKTEEVSTEEFWFQQRKELFEPEKKDEIDRAKNCFAAQDGLCTKSQRITLKDHGYWDELMDETNPTIEVTDWLYHTPSTRYEWCVQLLSADDTVLQKCQANQFDFFPSHPLPCWHECLHTFRGCSGVRHIVFQHQGGNVRRQQSEDGVRITNSSVTVLPSGYFYNDVTWKCWYKFQQNGFI